MHEPHQHSHHHATACGCGCGHSEHQQGATDAHTEQQNHSEHTEEANAGEADSGRGCGCGATCAAPPPHPQPPAPLTAEGCGCGCELAAANPHAHAHDDGCGCGHDHGQTTSKNDRHALLAAALLFVAGIALGGRGWPAFLAAYLIAGGPILLQMLRNFRQGRIFDEHTLMSITSLGAWAVGAQLEAAAVVLLYRVGEAIQARAVLKSRAAISALTDIRPATARLLEADGGLREIKPKAVRPGQLLQVRPGERLPVDSIVQSGNAHLDLSALTGESLPLAVGAGAEVKAGAINQDGLLVIEALRSYEDSAVAQILRLLEQSGAHKAPIESMISAFARRYTPLATLAALLLFAVPTLAGGVWQVWLYRAMVFLAASCPCALIISVPLTYYAGLGAAAKEGALIKGGNFLAALPQVKTVVFDKTGTLTEGVFHVAGIRLGGAYTEEQLLCFAARAEAASNHPLAQAVGRAYQEARGEAAQAAEQLHEEAGLGVVAQVDGKTVLVGNRRLLAQHGLTIPEQDDGETALHVAIDGAYAGAIAVRDRVKPQTAQAIAELKALGVRQTVLLSGDAPQIAERIARELAIDDAAGGLLPGDKVERLEGLLAARKHDEKLLFMGDGINDAPSLALADIGVAMGGLGAEAATAAADLVLLQDDPLQLTQAMRIARRTNRIARQNIIFSLVIKLGVLVLAALGISGMAAAVFADVGVTLLAVANGMRAMRQPAKPKFELNPAPQPRAAAQRA